MTEQILGVLTFLALPVAAFFYFRLLREFLDPTRPAAPQAYSRGDVVLGSVLGLLFLLLIMAGGEDPEPIEPTVPMMLQTGAFFLCLCFIVVSFMVFRDRDPIGAFGLLKGQWKLIPVATGWLLLALILVSAVQAGVVSFLGEPPAEQNVVALLRRQEGSALLLMVASVTVVAPLTEEFLFRGYLYGVLKRYGGRLAAMLVTAMLFSAIHLHAAAFLPLFVLAICLTLVYEHTGTLWAPILMHALFNGVSVVFILFFPELSSP